MAEIASAEDLLYRAEFLAEGHRLDLRYATNELRFPAVTNLMIGAALTAALDRNTAALETINETLNLIREDRLTEST